MTSGAPAEATGSPRGMGRWTAVLLILLVVATALLRLWYLPGSERLASETPSIDNVQAALAGAGRLQAAQGFAAFETNARPLKPGAQRAGANKPESRRNLSRRRRGSAAGRRSSTDARAGARARDAPRLRYRGGGTGSGPRDRLERRERTAADARSG